MGIRQLTSFVESHYPFLFKEQYYVEGKSLVFDGNALLYALLKLTKLQYGGNYNELYHIFKSYFGKLLSLKLKPYVILDGGHNLQVKLGTIIKRKYKQIAALRKINQPQKSLQDLPKPIFTFHVFVEALADMKIRFIVAEREADVIVAAISNKLACPVVTNDSDFYILNVNAGVITMRSMAKLIGKNPFVMLYHIKNLCQYLDLKPDYLKFLPVVLGNDYSDENNLELLQKNCGLRNKNGTLLEVTQRIIHLSSFLKTLNEEENIITGLTKGSTELRREIYKVLKEFNLNEVSENCTKLFSLLISDLSQEQHLTKVSNNSSATIAETLCLCCNIGLIDPCVVDIYFSNINVMSVQVEKLCLKTSEHVSTQMRWLLYAILHFKAQTLNEVVVTEYRRVGLEYKSKVLHLDLKEWDEIYHLDLQKLRIEPEDLFCKLTGFGAANLSLFRDSSLFLLSIHYCVSHIHELKIKLPYKLVAALILTFLLLQNGSTMTFETKKDINLDIAHICSSWQSVLFYLNILNVLLGFPFPMLKMSKTFDGQKMHYLFKELTEGGCKPKDFLQQEEILLFNQMIAAVIGENSGNISY